MDQSRVSCHLTKKNQLQWSASLLKTKAPTKIYRKALFFSYRSLGNYSMTKKLDLGFQFMQNRIVHRKIMNL